MNERFTKLIIWAPFMLWCLSLAVPAAGWGKNPQIMPGWGILLFGWIGIASMQFGWLANVAFLWSGILNLRAKRPSGGTGMILFAALILPTLQALMWRDVSTDIGRLPVTVGPGYYIWIAAMFGQMYLLFVTAFNGVKTD
ncbi:hypothetical protein [Sphingobium sp. AP50]|uniref:hypothetical protein n=1 Tax=Sphingobium sp. AP50 TaxID=1884369 RepID=UPI0011601C3C|nr:hypothetical protein [Sphingobium sp. AP50]